MRRLSRSRYRTLHRAVTEIGPAWTKVEGWHHHARLGLERWGLAEFRQLAYWRDAQGRRHSVWIARLTAEGIRLRDQRIQRAAEKASRERWG
jgi:hypothetical protein